MPAVASSAARRTLEAGGLTWAIVPLRVFGISGPSTASGANSRSTAMDSFFSGIGRGTGTIRCSSGPDQSELIGQQAPTSVHERGAQCRLAVTRARPAEAARRPPRSTTAACNSRKRWNRSAIVRFRPHSSTANA